MMDPISFEIMRHRLLTVNDEQAKTVIRTSGSPVVYESKDFNTALLGPDGASLFISTYAPILGMSLDVFTRSVLDLFNEEEINPGDMFFTNDPWHGVCHQNDQALVTPIFWEDAIICWAGVVIHDSDVGAPQAGINPMATDAHFEAPIIPPVKLVGKGHLRRDLEAWVMRNVRDPELNALHLRARISAVNAARARVLELVKDQGKRTFLEFQRALVDTVAQALQRRLAQLPDGTWREEILMDHSGSDPRALYRVYLTMTKRRDRLVFDFRGTDPQAPGPLNCAPAGLTGSVYAAVMSSLCYDIGWCPAALAGVIDIESEPGTVNNARYPAAVGLASVEAIMTTDAVARSCISKMCACSSEFRERAQAISSVTSTGSLIWSRAEDGKMKTTHGSFLMARGTGAYSQRDGMDTGGHVGAPGMSIFNVETAEMTNPGILVLYRKESPDTAGPGKFRGGVGMEAALTPRGNMGPLHVNWGSMGFHHPHPKGLYGGLPSSQSGTLILRGCTVEDLLEGQRRRHAPGTEIKREQTEILEAKFVGVLVQPGDVLVAWVEGGGGYGDPLEREPALVSRDVQLGLCSPDRAERDYGVVLDARSLAVDPEATYSLRATLRRARLDGALPVGGAVGVQRRRPEGCETLSRIGDALQVVKVDGAQAIVCSRCGYLYGPAERDPKEAALMKGVALEDLSPRNRYGFNRGDVVMRQFLCPVCGALINMEIRRTDEPVLLDTVLVSDISTGDQPPTPGA